MTIRAVRVRDFLEMIRFSHTVFALPFALLGACLACVVPLSAINTVTASAAQANATTANNAAMAEGLSFAAELGPGRLALRLCGVVLCMVTARSAAMAFNRLVDAAIDARNPRTSARHLPSGRLSRSAVWLFFAFHVLAFLASCTLFLPNWLPLAGAAPVLIWICGYSFAKRFTSAAHLWLGIALALSPVCAWLAVRGERVIAHPGDVGPAIGLAIAIACWVTGFDIIYACQDAEFDRREGLHSIPARFGVAGALRLAALAHALMLLTLAALSMLFPQLRLGWLYALALAVVAALVFVQHRLVAPDDLGRVNLAFFHVNAVISFGLSTATALDALA